MLDKPVSKSYLPGQRTKKHRGILAGLLLLAMAAAISLAGWQLFWGWLPDPASANRQQLFRWLVQRDLNTKSMETRLTLLDRLLGELRDGIGEESLARLDRSLSDSQRDLLIANTAVLKRDWFTSRVEEYHACPPQNRRKYLRDQIEMMTRWSRVEWRIASGNSSPQNANETSNFFDQIQQWIENESGTQRERMIEAVRQGIACWLTIESLSEQSMQTRRELVLRIVDDLNSGYRLEDAKRALSAEERERLVDNGELLMEAWLHELAGQFAKLPLSQREAFIDRRIDELLRWDVFDFLTTEQSAGANSKLVMLQWMGKIGLWIERADASQRGAMREMVVMVQTRWLQRDLEQQHTPRSGR